MVVKQELLISQSPSNDCLRVGERDRHPLTSIDESGQSLIEFLLTLPLMVIFVMMMIKINTVIQMSIVNQQYAREDLFFLMFNSSDYPELPFFPSGKRAGTGNRFVAGVAENSAPSDGGSYVPEASTYLITRKGKPVGSNADQEEPDLRGNIHVRDTISICTQVDHIGNGFKQVVNPALGGQPMPENLNDALGGSYCAGGSS